MKLALFWTNPYSANLGVGALTYSVLYVLEEISKEYDMPFEYFIMGYSGKINNNVITIADSKIPVTNIRNFSQGGLKGCAKKIIFYNQYKQLSKFDRVLDIGEGDSYADIYGINRFNVLNGTKRFFIKKKIKQLLLPQTIGPFNDKHVKAKAIDTIEKCDTVLARDKQSYDFLKNETRQSNIDEIVDVAFFMPYQKKSFSKDFVHVGLNVSALLWHGGYTKNNQFGLSVDYQKLIRNTIEYFLSIPNVKLHLVPHVVLTDYSDVENDYSLSFDLVEKYNNDRLVLSPFFLTPIFAKNYIAGMDFFAGARMHAAIAAFSSEVPVYPMAYSRKFNGLFADTLAYPHIGDMKAQTNDEILTGIQNAFAKRGELQATIHNRMTGIVAERKELLKKHLVEFLGLK